MAIVQPGKNCCKVSWNSSQLQLLIQILSSTCLRNCAHYKAKQTNYPNTSMQAVSITPQGVQTVFLVGYLQNVAYNNGLIQHTLSCLRKSYISHLQADCKHCLYRRLQQLRGYSFQNVITGNNGI